MKIKWPFGKSKNTPQVQEVVTPKTASKEYPELVHTMLYIFQSLGSKEYALAEEYGSAYMYDKASIRLGYINDLLFSVVWEQVQNNQEPITSTIWHFGEYGLENSTINNIILEYPEIFVNDRYDKTLPNRCINLTRKGWKSMPNISDAMKSTIERHITYFRDTINNTKQVVFPYYLYPVRSSKRNTDFDLKDKVQSNDNKKPPVIQNYKEQWQYSHNLWVITKKNGIFSASLVMQDKSIIRSPLFDTVITGETLTELNEKLDLFIAQCRVIGNSYVQDFSTRKCWECEHHNSNFCSGSSGGSILYHNVARKFHLTCDLVGEIKCLVEDGEPMIYPDCPIKNKPFTQKEIKKVTKEE